MIDFYQCTLSKGLWSLPRQLVYLVGCTLFSAHQCLCYQICGNNCSISVLLVNLLDAGYLPVSVIVHKSFGYIHSTGITWILKLFDIFFNQQTSQRAESTRRGDPAIIICNKYPEHCSKYHSLPWQDMCIAHTGGSGDPSWRNTSKVLPLYW